MIPLPKIAPKWMNCKYLCIVISLFVSGSLLAQPVITGFSPISGPVGSTVTISGSGFDNNIANNAVWFGGAKAIVTAASGNSLTVKVPGGATYEPITVTSNGFTAYSGKPFMITFNGIVNQNTANSFSQAIGVNAGGIKAVADLNNDGKPDLIGIGQYSNIPVWENTSTADKYSFNYHFDIRAGIFQSCYALGDIDGDGLIDITVGYSVTGLVVMKNTSSGGNFSFTAVSPFPGTRVGASQMFIRDMDGDGKPDVVTLLHDVNADNSRLAVYKNTTINGVISFAPAYEISYVNHLQGFNVGDIDNDGKPDIVAINSFTNALMVYRNTSTGAGFSFTEKNVYTLYPNSVNVKVVDLDNDDKPELMYVPRGINYDGTTISILKNTSSTDISFGNKVDLTAGPSIWEFDINDLNGDGMVDLTVPNNGTYSIFYKNSSNSISFAAKYDYPGYAGLSEPRSADLNGDNFPDLIGSDVIYKNQLTIDPQRFVPPVVTSFAPASGTVGSSVTITGTGFSSVAANNTVYFGSVKATITAASATSLTVKVPAQSTPQPISVTRELLTGYSAKPFVVTFTGGEAPFTKNLFGAGIDSVLPATPRDQCVSDLDGDGRPDLVIAANDLMVYRNTGSPGNISWAPKLVLSKQYSGTSVVVAADMNGDGKPDLITNGLVFVNTSTPGALSFKDPYSIGMLISVYPKTIVANDFDGDGRTDLIMSHGNGASLCRNKTVNDSVFFEVTDYSQGSLVTTIVSADFSGDGKPDIALLSTNTRQVIMCRNISTAGKIKFIADYLLPTGFFASDLAAGDLDGDGKPDVAVVDQSDTTLRIHRIGTGSGGAITWAGQTDYKTGKYVLCVNINDLNGDGKPDIALINGLDRNFAVYKNKSNPGSVSFDAPVSFNTPPEPSYIGMFDLDGDGLQDVVTSNHRSGYSSGFTISTYINQLRQPVITSVTPTVVTPGTTITINGYSFTNVTEVKLGTVAVQSFTVVSSTQITAVVGEGAEGELLVKTTEGNGLFSGVTFAAPVITSFTPQAATTGTVITIAGSNFSTVAANNHVYFGAVQATVTAATTTSLTVKVPAGATSCSNISVSTFSRIGYSAKPFVVTFPGIGNAFTAASFADKIELTAGKNPKGVAAGDLDNDGLPDMAVANYDDQSISILKNGGSNGQVQFTTAVTIPLSITPSAVTITDINADGKLDVVVVDYTYGNFNVFINNSTSGNIAFAAPVTFTTRERANDVAAADFDQDGRTDLVLINEDWADGLYVMRNTTTNGVVSFARADRFDFNYNYNPSAISIADMNDDGKPDLLVTYNSGKKIKVYKNISTSGAILFDDKFLINFTDISSPYGITAGDMDGDGKPEMAVVIDRAYYGEYIYVYKNTSAAGGAISFGATTTVPTKSNSISLSLSVGDMDGDGKPDIVSANPWGDSLMVFKNSSTASAVSFLPYAGYSASYRPYRICLADVDVDGKSDIIAVSSNTGFVNILRNRIGEPLVQPTGANPVSGSIVNNLTIDATVPTLNGSAYVQRHYDILPASNAATATATITLYFTQTEFDNFNATAGHGPDLPKNATDAAGKANVRIYQYHGFSATNLPGTYTGQGKEIDPDDANIVWNADRQWWEVTFDVNGFSGFFLSSVGFNYNQVPAPVITASGTTVFCAGGNVLLVSSINQNNQWYKDGVVINNANAATYQATAGGSYTVTITNNGITSPQSIGKAVVVNPIPAKPVITQNGSELVSSAPTGNQWYLEGALIAGATTQTFKPAATGNYSVKATVNGCAGPVSAVYNYLYTATIDLDNNNYISLTPNPVIDKAYLRFEVNGITTLSIQAVNLQGKVVQSWNSMSSGAALDLRAFPAGAYFILIKSSNGKINYTLKLLKL